MYGGNYCGLAYYGQAYGVAGVLFDSASSSGYEASLSTYNWTHVTYHSAMTLVVDVSIFATGSVTSVTYNGVGLTFLRADVQGVYRNELWYLANPAYGSHTLTVNLSASLTSIASAGSYMNTKTDSPIDADAGASGTAGTPTVSITPVSNGAWLVDGISTSATSLSPAATQTQRSNNSGALGLGGMSDKLVYPAAASSMSWGAVGALDSWALSVVALAPISATLHIKALTAGLSFSGSISRVSRKGLSGGLSFSGSLSRLVVYPLTASLSFSGSLARTIVKASFTAGLSFSGSLVKKTAKALAATASFSGTVARRTTRTLAAGLSFSAVLSRSITRRLSSTLSFSGLFGRTIPQALTASLSFSGSLSTVFFKGLLKFLDFIFNRPPTIDITLTVPAPLAMRLTLPAAYSFSLTISAIAFTVTRPASLSSSLTTSTIDMTMTIPGAINFVLEAV